MKRRDFLRAGSLAAGSLGLAGCSRTPPPGLPPGQLLGPSQALGHRLRDGTGFPAASETRKVEALIIGGGMAGLSCGWWLKRQGHASFAVLELENEAGGNARSGSNPISAYPWGAHYLPLPGPEAPELRLMLAEFGALKGDPHALRPEYEERYLCFAPQERLHIHGAWQEGLLPQFGIAQAERHQQQRFVEQIASMKATLDGRGRPAFATPSARGGSPTAALAGISMADWLQQQGYDAPSLHWWVNYGCRDDYGTDYRQTSAWAGLHYHAGRHGQASNADSDDVLTWPEGNSWLTRRMAQGLGDALQPNAMAWQIEQTAQGCSVLVYLAQENRSVRYLADKLVWAAPAGFLAHVMPSLPPPWQTAMAQLSYAPWLVANLSLRAPPAERGQQPLCWDNVLYGAAGLGYVVANHQSLQLHDQGCVLSYYRPLTEATPAAGRKLLQTAPHAYWARSILAELGRVHPDLPGLTEQLDVWRWGHAMLRPTPSLFSSDALPRLRQPQGRIMLAHSDLSGFSLAEEAHYWGVRAARWLLDHKDEFA
ncbi:amino oxidase [Chitinimonas prasina]|uniref:Amino oxidase n=1 Tax=Chitinimonas prasina TaxID=1434937 RepID=A0ABQ5YBX0_9NEIS|nr:NAD(P)/FAD-dependent oxidoreductase [Chitinimonas prasina]GLR11983.1 amino oxidase [Chitinimonas prasina]